MINCISPKKKQWISVRNQAYNIGVTNSRSSLYFVDFHKTKCVQLIEVLNLTLHHVVQQECKRKGTSLPVTLLLFLLFLPGPIYEKYLKTPNSPLQKNLIPNSNPHLYFPSAYFQNKAERKADISRVLLFLYVCYNLAILKPQYCKELSNQ